MVPRPDPLRSSRQRQPTFFWQGVLILLPVVVLAGAGSLSLRQDKALARHEASEKAQALAEDLAGRLWSKLTARANLEQFKDHAFHLDAQGRLLFPPAPAALPSPQPLDLASLSEVQRQWWLAANTPGQEASSRSEAIAACRQFIDLNPPVAFAGKAAFRLGLWLETGGNLAEAAAAYRQVLEKFPEATGESGLPLALLAQLKILQLTAGAAGSVTNSLSSSLASFCSNLVYHPAFLTPRLLGKAAEVEQALGLNNLVERWQSEWEQHESLRLLAVAAQGQSLVPPPAASRSISIASLGATNEPPPTSALFWFHAPDLSPNPQPILAPARSIGAPTRESEKDGRWSATFVLSGLSLPPPALPRRSVPQAERREVQWLASRLDDAQGGFWMVCRAMGLFVSHATNVDLDSPAWLDLRSSLPPLPPWLDFSLEVAGATVVSSKDLFIVSYRPAGKGGGQTWQKTQSSAETLATARRLERGIELLRVHIHLVSPEMLFARQKARSRLFGLLIGTSTFAAVIGFVSARRAFVRQQELSELKSNFVSSVSHELRAPIASVRLLAENRERGAVEDSARQREYFHFIGQECRRLSALIENVLNFARIEQGRKQ